ncbi:MAG: hypothetical protein OXE55_00250 [Flavobacteriaceae bacterium]|nr:hypothetical protein [Flavobacteriaceae bacterium]
MATESISNEDGSETELPQLKAKNTSEFFDNVKNRINFYVKENYSIGVNFEVIESLIHREVKVKEDEINHSITFPLYLGLIGTLFGVFFGLWSLLSQLDVSSGLNFAETNLDHFLTAILAAVIASILGLTFSTILSTFSYKSALKEVLIGKNELLFFLKAYFIPKLLEVDRDGIGGLRVSLEKFSRDAKTMSKNLVEASTTNSKNLEYQIQLMNRFEKLDLSQISIENVKIFEKLEDNLQVFNDFSKYLKSMEQISMNLESFASRTNNIDNIVNQVTVNIEQSNKVIQFINAHKTEIEQYKGSSIEFIGKVTQEIVTSLEKMKSDTEKLMKQYHDNVSKNSKSISESADKMKDDTTRIIEFMADNLRDSTEKVIKNYPELIDDLRLLNHLKKLPEIKEETKALNEKLNESIKSSKDKIIDFQKSVDGFLTSIEQSNRRTSESIKSIDKKVNVGNYKTSSRINQQFNTKNKRYHDFKESHSTVDESKNQLVQKPSTQTKTENDFDINNKTKQKRKLWGFWKK